MIIKLVIALLTTFVIVFPHFIIKSHPFYADIMGILFAVILNSLLHPELRLWNSMVRDER